MARFRRERDVDRYPHGRRELVIRYRERKREDEKTWVRIEKRYNKLGIRTSRERTTSDDPKRF